MSRELDNLIRCELDCGCRPEYPRDIVKTGQYVECPRHGATTIDRVWGSRWRLECTVCTRFKGWYETRDEAVDAADRHHGRTVANHSDFVLEFRSVSRTGETRSRGAATYHVGTVGQETLFDVEPPF